MTLTVCKSLVRDAFAIHLRDSDFEEAREWAPGVGPYRALGLSIRSSKEAHTVFQGDEVVCIFGYSHSDREVHPWLMCSDLISRHGKTVLKVARAFLKQVRTDNPQCLVCNHVYRSNEQAKRFLKALGFRIVPSPGDDKFDFFYLP